MFSSMSQMFFCGIVTPLLLAILKCVVLIIIIVAVIN